MSVPLDRLYNFLHDVVDHDITIYRFWPHGSKKLENLLPLVSLPSWHKSLTTPHVIFHDQEPLNFRYWTDHEFVQIWEKLNPDLPVHVSEYVDYQISTHLRGLTPTNLYDYVVLVHSEKNSKEVDTYSQHGFLPVYYWSHAVIAADWFRYAKQDPDLVYCTDQITHDFLIYNRAWSGTREYRLKFAEQLVNTNLHKH